MHSPGWQFSKKAEEDILKEDLNQHTVGYFFKDTGYSVIVVQSYGNPEKDGERNVDSLMEIPRVSITKIRKL